MAKTQTNQQVEIQQPGGDWITTTIAPTFQLTPHFQAYEIWNANCTPKTKLKLYNNLTQDSFLALRGLEYLRERKGSGIVIGTWDGKGGSGYRETNYNKSVGGVNSSLHLYCAAFDLQEGKLTDARFMEFKYWIEEFARENDCQAECGRYSWGIHAGWMKKLPYSYNGTVYVFDKR